MVKKILEYSITFTLCALITFIIIAVKGTFSVTEARTAYHYLTDSFFVTGIICAAFGLLVMASNGGAFDFIVYGFSRFISLFRKGKVKYKIGRAHV